MCNDPPLVCICIPTFNAASTVRETLQSILAQTYSNLLVHISDNASTDDTLKIIESIVDSRITTHLFNENVGGEGNFNRCIQFAEGKYTAIFHADDIYEPDMLAKQVAFLEAHLNAGAVFTEASLIDETGHKIGKTCLPQSIASSSGLYDFTTMFKAVLRYGNFFICPSFMFRTQVLQHDIKVWRGEQFGSGADLDVWLRILQHHSLGHIPERLMRYRISNQQFSARIRLETERGPVFKIIDYYLQQNQVKVILNQHDLLNYKRLDRRDRVGRAINLFLSNRHQEVKLLLSDIYTWDTFISALNSRQGLYSLLTGVYVKLLMTTGFNKMGKASLTYMKQVMRK